MSALDFDILPCEPQPRNHVAFRRGQRHYQQIREIMWRHSRLNPLARPLTAKEIHREVRDITPAQIWRHMNRIRLDAEAEFYETGQVSESGDGVAKEVVSSEHI